MRSWSQKRFIYAWTFCDKSTAFAGLTNVAHVFMTWVNCFSFPALINNEAWVVLQLGSQPPGAMTWAGTEHWCQSEAEAHSSSKLILSRVQQPHNTNCCYKYSSSLVRSRVGDMGSHMSFSISHHNDCLFETAISSEILSILSSCPRQILPKGQQRPLSEAKLDT